jgi:hypothetical protein
MDQLLVVVSDLLFKRPYAFFDRAFASGFEAVSSNHAS